MTPIEASWRSNCVWHFIVRGIQNTKVTHLPHDFHFLSMPIFFIRKEDPLRQHTRWTLTLKKVQPQTPMRAMLWLESTWRRCNQEIWRRRNRKLPWEAIMAWGVQKRWRNQNLKTVQPQTPMRTILWLEEYMKEMAQPKFEKDATANSRESLLWLEEYKEGDATTHFN